MNHLQQLSKPFHQRVISTKPGSYSASYVTHGVVRQRLIGTLGRPPDQKVVQVLTEDLPPVLKQNGDEKYPAAPGCVVGAVVGFTFHIDGEYTYIEEAGGVENPQQVAGNGERLKHAISDALKRAAAAIGCGLHLWVDPGFYFLDRMLDDQVAGQEPDADVSAQARGMLLTWLNTSTPEQVVHAIETEQVSASAVYLLMDDMDEPEHARSIERALQAKELAHGSADQDVQGGTEQGEV